MEKYIEENPLDIDREDDTQINKNDISKKKKSIKGFVVVEQIPEIELTTDEPREFIEVQNADHYYDRLVKKEANDDIRAEESDKRKIEQLSKELRYHESPGMASVYTEEEFSDIEKELTPRVSRCKTDKQITSMSPEQISRESTSEIKNKRVIRSHSMNHGNTGIEKDNLKTIPEFKKHKKWRQKIKDFFTKQNNQETAEGKLEQTYDSYPLDREEQVPTLNDRPMDKRFLENDDNRAA